MKVLFFSLTIALLCFSSAVLAAHKILAGRTGNGKSYIATILGCESKTCPDQSSCTKETKVCDNGIIDTIGLDDDNIDNDVDYQGAKIKLSGLTYPVYSLFDTIETEKLSDVEFYLVSDANNPKLGTTAKFFMDFVKTDLKCDLNTVLNKYRSSKHSVLAKGYDFMVPEDADKLVLNGRNCRLSLAKNWRDRVIMSDLAGVRSKVDIENCEKLLARKNKLEELLNQKPQPLSMRSCDYDKVVGHVPKGNDWHVNVGPISVGSSGGMTAITERAVDEDCARKESATNDEIIASNQRLHEERKSLLAIIGSVDEGLTKCKNYLINWDADGKK